MVTTLDLMFKGAVCQAGRAASRRACVCQRAVPAGAIPEMMCRGSSSRWWVVREEGLKFARGGHTADVNLTLLAIEIEEPLAATRFSGPRKSGSKESAHCKVRQLRVDSTCHDQCAAPDQRGPAER